MNDIVYFIVMSIIVILFTIIIFVFAIKYRQHWLMRFMCIFIVIGTSIAQSDDVIIVENYKPLVFVESMPKAASIVDGWVEECTWRSDIEMFLSNNSSELLYNNTLII